MMLSRKNLKYKTLSYFYLQDFVIDEEINIVLDPIQGPIALNYFLRFYLAVLRTMQKHRLNKTKN
jgi:hypothetical protein